MINHPAYSHSLKKLGKLHADLAKADKKWLDAVTTARRVNLLIARLDEFWCDLPKDCEPVLQAFERTNLLMKFIIVACATERPMLQSFATRTLVRDTLDDLCIAIATYREGFNDD